MRDLLCDEYGPKGWAVFLIWIVFVLSLVALIIFVGVQYDRASCTAIGEMTGYNTQWVPHSGCWIEHNEGVWIPYERWIHLEE